MTRSATLKNVATGFQKTVVSPIATVGFIASYHLQEDFSWTESQEDLLGGGSGMYLRADHCRSVIAEVPESDRKSQATKPAGKAKML